MEDTITQKELDEELLVLAGKGLAEYMMMQLGMSILEPDSETITVKAKRYIPTISRITLPEMDSACGLMRLKEYGTGYESKES